MKFILCLGAVLFSFSAMAADCASELSESRLNILKKQADKALKSPRGKTYVDSVMQKVGPGFSKVMLECRDKNSGEKFPLHLDLVLEVGKDLLVKPYTRASSNIFCECVKAGFPKVMATKPPFTPFPIYVEARMEADAASK